MVTKCDRACYVSSSEVACRPHCRVSAWKRARGGGVSRIWKHMGRLFNNVAARGAYGDARVAHLAYPRIYLSGLGLVITN